MAHAFRVGDRVCNGQRAATVIALVADDFLEVRYDDDADGEPTSTELALYFSVQAAKEFDNRITPP